VGLSYHVRDPADRGEATAPPGYFALCYTSVVARLDGVKVTLLDIRTDAWRFTKLNILPVGGGYAR
jgi:hypothetical protein